MAKIKRVFVAFAKEDEKYRNLIKGQSLHTKSPFEYVDMSVKEPYDSGWKTKTRSRIKGSDGVIALLSKNSPKAAGELWEITCAVAEKKKLLGIYVDKNDKTKPKELGTARCVEWTWDGVASFIEGL